MGKAELWQDRVAKSLEGHCDFIFNPRRDDWDSSWIQSIHNKQFNEQVNWEMDHLELADVVFFYFDPNTQSPITLLELGLTADTYQNIIVVCPAGYWRKGNVEIVCSRYEIPLFNCIEDGICAMIEILNEYKELK